MRTVASPVGLSTVEPKHRKADSGTACDNSTGASITDDLDRQVYCILGVPIDAIDLQTVLRQIDASVARSSRLFIATPNINFLVTSQTDPDFKESLLASDLCPVDGMPIVWIAKLLGVPIQGRTAGSDIFAALRTRPTKTPLKVFLFGATESVGKTAEDKINQAGGLRCVGRIAPGFGEVQELSDKRFFERINESGADFLVAALGARKGQLWLHRNQTAIRSPVRAHLGAVINFEAGTIRRAPQWLGKLGLEWVWRIKEEPVLWTRYLRDGVILLRLLLTRIIPLALAERIHRGARGHELVLIETQSQTATVIHLSGYALAPQVEQATAFFRDAVRTGKRVVLDCRGLGYIDARFYGLLLMLRKQLLARGERLTIEGISPGLRRQFRRNGLENTLISGGNP